MIWLSRRRGGQKKEDCAMPLRHVKSGFILPIDQHHPHALAGVEEDDATDLKGASDLIASRFIHLKSAVGFETLQSGQ